MLNNTFNTSMCSGNNFISMQFISLNTQIIAYYLFKKQYQEAYSYSQIPINLRQIIGCYISQNTPMNYSSKFGYNISSEKYKYFTLFLLFYSFHKRMKKLDKEAEIYNYDFDKLNNEKLVYLYIDDRIFYDSVNVGIFFNEKRINFFLEEFFEVEELLNTFDIDKTYKKYILVIIDAIEYEIKISSEEILKEPFPKYCKNEINERIMEFYKDEEKVINNLFGTAINLKSEPRRSLDVIKVSESKDKLLFDVEYRNHMRLKLQKEAYKKILKN